MTIQEAIYCMKVYVEDKNCESCPFFYDDNAGDCIANASRLAIEALEKQIPKKPKNLTLTEGIMTTMFECPVCRCRRLGHGFDLNKCFCPECGQKLDWN